MMLPVDVCICVWQYRVAITVALQTAIQEHAAPMDLPAPVLPDSEATIARHVRPSFT